ncbi:ferritin-like domain-containing protein [Anthocerotibacter panamensis]|uniref:ferritin-like domain-containing protein n=1 Tax=Anthocerotibacter panamensis TaxID=2857077 RepID=UPI001C408697|nr:ferritin-like domain-containing protein [Anthocerotibacter panamensis]
MKIGSEAHKELFCRDFVSTHRPYDPQNFPWPELTDHHLRLLRGIPFWGEALKVETNAGVMVTAFAKTVADPVLREAIALQGREEARHARLLEVMMERYGIEVERPVVTLPEQVETAFIDLGHEECLDSFFAFGFFEVAKRAQLFPEAMFTIFESILDEEARHIVFFVNWMTYLQIQRGQGAGLLRSARSLYYYGRALNRLVGSLKSGNTNGPGFTANGASALGIDLTPGVFVSTCLQENERRVNTLDARLLRPQLMPALFTGALRVLELFSPPKLRPRATS